MSNSGGTISGQMPGGGWWPVVYGYGYYSVNYSVSIGVPGGKYQCWIAPVPFPISSGNLPQEDLTFQVVVQGVLSLWSPRPTTYFVTPVSGG